MRAPKAAALLAALTAGPSLAAAQTVADAGAAPSAPAAPSEAAPEGAADAHEVPPEEPKPAPKKSSIPLPLSIMGGLRLGALVPAGDIGQAPQPAVAVAAAVDLAIEGGATIYEHFYGGLIFGGSFYISPENTAKSVNSILFGTEVAYLTNPNGLGGFFGLGLGYRRYFISDALGNANSVDGPDALATIALHIRASSAVRLLPRFDFAVGPAGGYTHVLFFFGISAWLNHDVARGPERR